MPFLIGNTVFRFSTIIEQSTFTFWLRNIIECLCNRFDKIFPDVLLYFPGFPRGQPSYWNHIFVLIFRKKFSINKCRFLLKKCKYDHRFRESVKIILWSAILHKAFILHLHWWLPYATIEYYLYLSNANCVGLLREY